MHWVDHLTKTSTSVGLHPCVSLYTEQRGKHPGSTHTITPRQFIDDLKVLELGGVGSRAVPNGVSTSAAQQSYQEYYDQKYFTPDPAPPQRPTLTVPKDSGSSVRTGKPSKSSPSSPYATSSTSVNSTGAVTVDEKKKKKKGFFHF